MALTLAEGQDGSFGSLAVCIVEIDGCSGGPFGDLAETQVDATRLLLLGDLAEVLDELAGDDFAAAEDHL